MSMPTTVPVTYDAETRFGVVMYGGVSLAIYIYGVTNELFELACATPREGYQLAMPDGEGTRAVYARLARLASDPALVQRYAQALRERDGETASAARREVAGPPLHTAPVEVWQPAWDEGERTRFVIDVIAGTSAGGINGIYLAKALALAQPFSTLRDLWINEGDLGRLLNDEQAADGVVGGLPTQPDGPKSLLSSDRMYRKLLDALEGMQAAGAVADSPLVEDLDLYVTTTDIVGAPVPLRLYDKVVMERRHKQRFHFSYPSRLDGEPAGHDFDKGNHAFLAFTARCTSSFPFAFEPMQFSRVPRLAPDVGAARLGDWKPYFDAYEPQVLARDDWADRPYGDGGYLDNKPFSYVVDALSQRFGDAPAQRKLLYIEPDPERLDAVRSADAPVPNALRNALDALSAIPLSETIREDLLNILQRNRRIERVERLLRLSEQDVEGAGGDAAQPYDRVRCEPAEPGQPGMVQPWSSLPLRHMVDFYGSGFLPYRRLRVYAVTDWMAAQLASAFQIDPDSDRGYALRAVVRAWREQHYVDDPSQSASPQAQPPRSMNAFLDDHDFDYRVRRGSFVLRRIDQLTRLLVAHERGALDSERSELEALIARKVARVFGDRNPLAQPASMAPTLNALRALKRAFRADHRALQRERLHRARGYAVPSAITGDAELRRELDGVLARLIDEGDANAPLALRTTDPAVLAPMPNFGAWLQTSSASHTLQDSVMDRVNVWLAAARATGRPPLLLWTGLSDALNALRIRADKAERSVANLKVRTRLEDPVLHQWALLGRPQLVAEERQEPKEIDRERRLWRAELAVDPVAVDDPELAAGQAEQAAMGTLLRQLLGEYYLSFEAYDQTRYTLYFDTGTGEPAVVDVLRVSPEDATSLRPPGVDRQTLAGTLAGHFGAFLDEQWRRNDIMWGRLDGAERLIQSVLSGEAADTVRVRDELIRLAQSAILQHTMQSTAAARLTGCLRDGLQQPVTQVLQAPVSSGAPGHAPQTPAQRLEALLTAVAVLDSPAQRRQVSLLAGHMVPAALQALLTPSALRYYAGNLPTFNPKPPTEPLMRQAARAITITGQVVDGMATGEGGTPRLLGRWLMRLGHVLQAAVAVAVPGVGMPVARRVFQWLYGMEVLLLVAAIPFGDPGLRALAIVLLVVTGGSHLALLLLRDVLADRGLPSWLAWLGAAIGLALLALCVVGGLALWHHGLGAVSGVDAHTALPGKV